MTTQECTLPRPSGELPGGSGVGGSLPSGAPWWMATMSEAPGGGTKEPGGHFPGAGRVQPHVLVW